MGSPSTGTGRGCPVRAPVVVSNTTGIPDSRLQGCGVRESVDRSARRSGATHGPTATIPAGWSQRSATPSGPNSRARMRKCRSHAGYSRSPPPRWRVFFGVGIGWWGACSRRDVRGRGSRRSRLRVRRRGAIECASGRPLTPPPDGGVGGGSAPRRPPSTHRQNLRSPRPGLRGRRRRGARRAPRDAE